MAAAGAGLPLLQVGLHAAALRTIPQLAGRVPKGYLRVLVFNQDSVLVDQRQFQLSQAAQGHYEVLGDTLTVRRDGYVTVYVGNESAVDVYFDELSIEHRQGLLVQETQYDPAGLELTGLAPPSPGIRGLNNYRFNGKEFQADLGLNWNHQDWRFFDPQLLRWHTGDPEIENGQESWTPYSFSYDNAVRYADANGRAPEGPGDPPSSTVLPAPGVLQQMWRDITNPSDFKHFLNDLGTFPPISVESRTAGVVLGALMEAASLANILPAPSQVAQPSATTLPSDRAYTPPRSHTSGAILNATAAESLPQMKGSSSAKVERTMAKEGFSLTKRTSTGNSTYTHPDGSEVRHHPYGNEQRSQHKSANNAHLHKQNPPPTKAQLDDKGRASTDPNATHIGTRNPADLPQVRGRPHGV